MLNFSVVPVSPDERATDNTEMRVRPSDKERISRAVELTGVKLTKFVRASAAREAERILRERQTTTLSEHDRRVLLEALDNSPPTRAARHDRSGFSCATDRLDNFQRLSAGKQQQNDFTRVFVAVAEGLPEVVGCCALNAHAVATGQLGADRPMAFG